jgi:hypothetical protein
MAISLKERFLSKFVIGNINDCWEWKASKNKKGYGQLSNIKGQPNYIAHRLSYELFVGPIPDDMWVLHDCDNPPCVNPNHLHLGTVKDNVREMFERGRNKARTPDPVCKKHGLKPDLYRPCPTCMEEYKANKGERLAYQRNYYSNPEHKEKHRLAALASYHKNKQLKG